MSLNKPHLYLASQSPRRRELLKQIGIHFEPLLLRNDPSRGIDVDEIPLHGELPEVYVERVCREKAAAAVQAITFRNLRSAPILTADTIVTINGNILGKPSDDKHATEMLRSLSGNKHQVLTAVAVVLGDRIECRTSNSTITFATLSDSDIRRYLRTGEAHGKAGSYGIQGHAGAFVERLEGSYTGVVGLPLFETVELLKSFGIATA